MNVEGEGISPEKILESVFDLVRNFTKFFSFTIEAEEMKTIELYILLFVALKGPRSMSSLAKEYSMTKSNITVLVDDMENKGYLARVRSEEDRRVIMITLTERGKAFFESFLANFSKLISTFIKKVGSEDLAIITEGFERITRIVIDENSWIPYEGGKAEKS
jgi:DNA-binding MarR family transcriptional regulator